MKSGDELQRTAVVTGGSKGIGREIVNRLAANGYHVEFCARDELSVTELDAELNAQGHSVLGSVCDVSIEDKVEKYIKGISSRRGIIDVIVNNAGTSGGGEFARLETIEWRRVFAGNIDSTFFMCRAVLAHGGILRSPLGRIINIASTAGKQGIPLSAPYNASKHAVIGLTRSLALELAKTSVTVNAVCPGYVETPMAGRILEAHAELSGHPVETIRRLFTEKIPIGRYTRPSEVAGLVTYLVGEDASSITGQAINVCGGLGRF